MDHETDPLANVPDFSPENIRPGTLPGCQEENLNIIAQTVASRKALGDLVQDNPQFVPWAVVIPYLVEQDMHHATMCVRAPTASAASSLAIMLWDRQFRHQWPAFIDPKADYQGKVHIRRLDESDYQEIFHYLWKKARIDFHKWPLVATGTPSHHCTAFYAPWFDTERHDFSDMRDQWLDNRIISPES